VRRALQEGAAVFEPGLLAAAHRGVLYADEVNLLPDAAVDVLLDVAASGVNVVERDGHGVRHPARFLLVGTMNPEEGELRPQLLDRFGLGVEVRAPADPALRTEVVRRRLRFDADPHAFVAAHAAGERTLADRLVAARAALPTVRLPDRQLVRITALCARLQVDGLRADLACTRAALALAALDGAGEVGETHVERAAALALTHRLRRDPLSPPPSPQTVRDALSDQDREGEPPPPEDEPQIKGSDPLREEPQQSAGSPDEDEMKGSDPFRGGGGAQTVEPEADVAPPVLRLDGLRGQGAAGRRARATGTGTVVGARHGDDDIAIVPTLVAARGRGVTAGDLRSAQREGRQGALVVLCVDASGSMGARKRMALVKGTVLALLGDAYQRRDRVALVTFRGTGAELALAPTGAVDHAATALRTLPTGGRTPIAAGLALAADVVRRERLREPDRAAVLVLVSDGRANAGGDPLGAAAALHRHHIQLVVVDGEQGPVRLGGAARIAAAAGGQVLALDAHDPQAADHLAGRLRTIAAALTTRSAA
jgi:magnesium chelatase subunit D